MLAVGNFFFRWRDTAFTLIFLAAFYLITIKEFGVGGLREDIITSIAGFVVAGMGQFARAITIGLAYIKRGGLNKKIYADDLVKRGMFAHCRNPLYLGNLLIVTGVIISINVTWYYYIALPLFYFIYMCITLAEENFLRGKFGEAYDQYCKEVPNRFIPGQLSKWKQSTEGMDFTWKRLIKKEHSAFAMLVFSLAIVAILKLHFRHDIAWNTPVMYALGGVILSMIIFNMIAARMKKTGKLEWDPNRP